MPVRAKSKNVILAALERKMSSVVSPRWAQMSCRKLQVVLHDTSPAR